MCHAENCGTGEGKTVYNCGSAEHVLDPVGTYPAIRPRLREIATELKHLDGEHWAAGEVVERACNYFDDRDKELAVGVEADSLAQRADEAAEARERYDTTHPEDREPA